VDIERIKKKGEKDGKRSLVKTSGLATRRNITGTQSHRGFGGGVDGSAQNRFNKFTLQSPKENAPANSFQVQNGNLGENGVGPPRLGLAQNTLKSVERGKMNNI